MEAFIDLVSKLGIPSAFLGGILFLLFKYVPKFLDMWIQSKEKQYLYEIEKQKEQQMYYTERQKSYDEQMGVIARIAEQSNRVIMQSTAVIERNNIVFEQGVQTNERVAVAMNTVSANLEQLSGDIEAAQVLLNRHDARAESMNADIIKIKERFPTKPEVGKR